MNFNTILLIVILLVIAVVGGAWWYKTQYTAQPAPSSGLQLNVGGNY